MTDDLDEDLLAATGWFTDKYWEMLLGIIEAWLSEQKQAGEEGEDGPT